jgi:nicotinamidase-related amidase
MPRIVAQPTAPYPGPEVLRRCLALAAAVRAAGGLVVCVRVERPGVPEQPPGSGFASGGEPGPGDLEIVKHTWGAFQDTGLHEALTARGCDTLVLAGLMTNMGVESTGRAADELGYRTVYAADAMAGLHAHAHEFAVGYVFPRLGTVCTTADLLAALPDAGGVVDRCVARIRAAYPEAVAVFHGGSRLRGDAGPFSDVDFDVVVPDGPREEEAAWFEQVDGRPVRVSAWVRDADRWLADAAEPQDWAFGLSSADPLGPCWVADDAWRARLNRPAAYPAGEPELGHLLGDAGKVANAYLAGDPLALRLAAQDLARSVPAFLAPLNPGPPVPSRYAALRAALDFSVAPPGHRADLLTCLGLAAGPTTPEQVYAAAGRLATGLLDLVAARPDGYPDVLSPGDLAETRRYVAGMFDVTVGVA